MARILVVDDNEDIRRVTARILRQCGSYEVVTAGGGVEALEIIDREPVDLVLLDYSMPDLDGLSVLERLCDETGQPRVPVVMFSAMADQREEALRLGAVAFLVKLQVGVDELTQQIRRCLAAGITGADETGLAASG